MIITIVLYGRKNILLDTFIGEILTISAIDQYTLDNRVYLSTHRFALNINVMNSLEDRRYVMLQLKAIYFVHSSGNTQINESCLIDRIKIFI